MSLLFWDSFDHYATADRLEKWSSVQDNPDIGAYGRNSTNGVRVHGFSTSDGYLRGPVSGTPDTVIIGFGFEVESMPTSGVNSILGIIDGATYQITLTLGPDGSLAVWRSEIGTWLAASDCGIIHAGAYYYVELKVYFDNAAGTVQVKLNEDTMINAGGLDTMQTGNAYCTEFELGGDSTNPALVHRYLRYDDVYVCDNSGAQCNDFLGDVRLFMLLPDGAGAHADWAPLVGANWQEVDDNPPDDDTTYNASNTVTDRDSFTFDDLPGTLTGAIHAFCAVINSRRDDAVAHELEPSVRVGGTDYDGAAELITDAYSFYNMYAWELNPDIAGAWTIAAVNATESGYELTV